MVARREGMRYRGNDGAADGTITRARDAMPAPRATREWRPAEHTRQRAIFHDLGNAPYHRRESFDAEKLAAELAMLRHEEDETNRRMQEGRARAVEAERDAAQARKVEALEVRYFSCWRRARFIECARVRCV